MRTERPTSGVLTPDPARAKDANRAGMGNVIRPPAFQQTDSVLAEAAQRGDRAALSALLERHAQRVTRLLARIMGPDPELCDHVQDVFHLAVRDLHTLRDPAAFAPWLSTLTVYAARGIIKKRQRFRWFFRTREPADPEPAVAEASAERDALRVVYEILDRMAVDERTAFALRFLDGMELTEVAHACGVSLATIKRRLRLAEDRFAEAARTYSALGPWLQGSRWEGT